MAAGKYNFTIEQGSTVDFAVQYKNPSNLPIDLTGYQARMQLRPVVGSEEVYLTLSSSLGPCGTGLNFSGSGGPNAFLSPTEGNIGVYISATSSSQLTFNSAYYDLEIATGSEGCVTVTRLLEGNVKLSPNITLGSFG